MFRDICFSLTIFPCLLFSASFPRLRLCFMLHHKKIYQSVFHKIEMSVCRTLLLDRGIVLPCSCKEGEKGVKVKDWILYGETGDELPSR